MTAQALLPLQGLAGLLPGSRAEPEGDAVLFVPVERRAFRWTDLQQVPDDGNRHEIIDGGLLVTPPPDTERTLPRHCADVLRAAAPTGVAVYTSAMGSTSARRCRSLMSSHSAARPAVGPRSSRPKLIRSLVYP